MGDDERDEYRSALVDQLRTSKNTGIANAIENYKEALNRILKEKIKSMRQVGKSKCKIPP